VFSFLLLVVQNCDDFGGKILLDSLQPRLLPDWKILLDQDGSRILPCALPTSSAENLLDLIDLGWRGIERELDIDIVLA
jgi:hypothetical protein